MNRMAVVERVRELEQQNAKLVAALEEIAKLSSSTGRYPDDYGTIARKALEGSL